MLIQVESFKVSFILLTTFILLFNLKWIYKKIRMIVIAWRITGPSNIFLIGAFYAGFHIKNTEDVVKIIQRYHEKYGLLYKIWMGWHLIISCCKAEDLEIILNSDKSFEKSLLYYHVKPFAPDGIGLVNNLTWKHNRRVLSNLLNHNIIENFFDQMYASAERLVGKTEDIVKNAKDNEETCIYHSVETNMVELVSEVLFGVLPNTKLSIELCKLFNCSQQFITNHLVKIWTYMELIFKISPQGFQRRKLMQRYCRATEEIIKQNRNEISKNGYVNNHPKHFLKTLIGEHKLNNYELHNEIVHFLTAGADSTSTTINYVLMCLGIFPEVQERVYQEIMEGIGKNRKMTKEDLPKLEYLQRVIFETLRFFPAAQNISREVTEDLKITDNVTLPMGAILILSIHNLHMNPSYWPEPWRFNPDRFLPDNVAKRQPYTYLAFSGGIRNCLGYKYTKMNVKTFISCILLAFKVHCGYKSLKEVRHDMKFVNSPVFGYKLRLYKRD